MARHGKTVVLQCIAKALLLQCYYEDRSDGLKPLGEFAFQFLKKCKKEKSVLIVSDIVELELLSSFSKDIIEKIFEEFIDLILKVNHSKAQGEDAILVKNSSYFKVPLFDVLHAIIARDNNAILVSRDNHFSEIGLIDCFKPEELL